MNPTSNRSMLVREFLGDYLWNFLDDSATGTCSTGGRVGEDHQ